MGESVFRREEDILYEKGDADSSEQSSPLGLTLNKTPSFLSLVQRSLCKEKQDNQSSQHDKPARTKKDDLGFEKLKASNFPAVFIKIGVWQRKTKHEGDLTAKLYYAKRKLVWEVLNGALKSKIEIQWSDIIAIRAITPDDEPGTLEIELNRPPLFYREINPQPRKHTVWQQASDFTGGQAPIWRRHYVRFPTGILNKHYEQLLQCDDRLFALSQKPFPRHESPYFDPTVFGISGLSLSFNGSGSSAYFPTGMQYRYHTYPLAPTRAPLTLAPNSTFPGASDNQFVTETHTGWGQRAVFPGGNIYTNQAQFSITPSTPVNQDFNSLNYHPNHGLLNGIENHLLAESEVGSSDERTIDTRVESMLEPSKVNVEDYNANYRSDQVMMQHERYVQPMLDDTTDYSEPLIWLHSHQYNDNTLVMEQTVRNSLSPLVFHDNTINQDFI